MDNVARLPASDRSDLFTAASNARGDMLPVLIEKDFWVCWTLKRLFTLSDPPAGLIFKGGTSLSKVYQAIDRFSEDVDLSFDRSALGFGGDKDPAQASSKKQAANRLEALSDACREMIRTQFLSRLEASFASALGAKTGWRVELDPDDADGQTVLFHYPAGIAGSGDPAARYLRPVIRLELGARGEQWPAERAAIASYASQSIPKPFKEPECTVNVLSAERTFWEKATILHALFHSPAEKPLRDRQSRHYYDLMKLYQKGPGKKALGDLSLLASVVKHKTVFFQSAAARYDEAVPGTLRLVPPPSRRKELEDDYTRMREMIFGAPPAFDEIIAALADIERQVNKTS